MSLSNFITELLQLKDQNIEFSEDIHEIRKKDILYKLVCARLSYTPECCPVCGVVNEATSIIKHGTKSSDIKLLPCNGNPTILRLHKQRFFCRECGHTFSAKTDIVEKNCFISRQVKLKILFDLKLKMSEKDIAFSTFVSHSTVSRAIDRNYQMLIPDRGHLPRHLMFDEFRSASDASGSMSFMYADCDTHEIIDIVEDRRLHSLRNYFLRFDPAARRQVETICIDIYAPYMSLIREMFPNADVVIDRFHIVQLLSRALNKTRVNTMKNYRKRSKEYKRLKKYWKLILKDEQDLDGKEFKPYTHFRQWVCMKTVVSRSISCDHELKATYDAYQTLLYDIKTKNSRHLIEHLKELQSSDISSDMKTAISTLLQQSDYVKNALKYEYSNGTIEGLNNYIKVIKRIAFGYQSFFHFRNRILISRGLIKPIEKYRAA